ncbi:hypothetical protein OG520_24970 [Streptomyces sp. NBC_00984]|uniref:hypothetical protein n=1 Tax=Streptomyces sp. NBC_00984 TaxID=2903700 RepID=UPI00386D8021|nr:hypothetical protein OG520_24970 [Streptomyces sp. NBC_00984]
MRGTAPARSSGSTRWGAPAAHRLDPPQVLAADPARDDEPGPGRGGGPADLGGEVLRVQQHPARAGEQGGGAGAQAPLLERGQRDHLGPVVVQQAQAQHLGVDVEPVAAAGALGGVVVHEQRLGLGEVAQGAGLLLVPGGAGQGVGELSGAQRGHPLESGGRQIAAEVGGAVHRAPGGGRQSAGHPAGQPGQGAQLHLPPAHRGVPAGGGGGRQVLAEQQRTGQRHALRTRHPALGRYVAVPAEADEGEGAGVEDEMVRGEFQRGESGVRHVVQGTDQRNEGVQRLGGGPAVPGGEHGVEVVALAQRVQRYGGGAGRPGGDEGGRQPRMVDDVQEGGGDGAAGREEGRGPAALLAVREDPQRAVHVGVLVLHEPGGPDGRAGRGAQMAGAQLDGVRLPGAAGAAGDTGEQPGERGIGSGTAGHRGSRLVHRCSPRVRSAACRAVALRARARSVLTRSTVASRNFFADRQVVRALVRIGP